MLALRQSNVINLEISKAARKATYGDNINRSDFLAAICHDLKTPISAIIGLSQAIKDGQLDEESIKESIDDINYAALEMLDLVHDLLDAKQVQSGDFSINKHEVSIEALVRRVISLNSNYAARRKIRIVNATNENIGTIHSDSKRLKQVLTNLISNAIKYSKENTCITIYAKKFQENGAEFLEIIVSDQGLGMTEWQISIALQKYHIIENDNSSAVDSFGLGLPIVKKLVESLGGEMEITSKLHEGTDVRLVFSC